MILNAVTLLYPIPVTLKRRILPSSILLCYFNYMHNVHCNRNFFLHMSPLDGNQLVYVITTANISVIKLTAFEGTLLFE